MSDPDKPSPPPLPAEPYRPNPMWEAGWAARDALDRDDADPAWLPDDDYDAENDRALVQWAAELEETKRRRKAGGRPRGPAVLRSPDTIYEARDAAATKAGGPPTQREVCRELGRGLGGYVDGFPLTTFKAALAYHEISWEDLKAGRRRSFPPVS